MFSTISLPFALAYLIRKQRKAKAEDMDTKLKHRRPKSNVINNLRAAHNVFK